MEREGEYPTLQEFDDRYRGKNSKSIFFTDYARDRLLTNEQYRKATRQTHMNTLEVFDKIIGQVKVKNISKSHITKFHHYLTKETKLKKTSIDKYHRHIKAHINAAIQDDSLPIKINPYDHFKYDKGKHEKKDSLTLAEIERIANIPSDRLKGTQQRSRDAFVFGCYTGLRISSLKAIKLEDFYESDGGLFLKAKIYKQKFSKPKVIELPLSLLFIEEGKMSRAERWARKTIDHARANKQKYLFAGLNTSSNSIDLPMIAELAKIRKKLSSHVGRVTLATTYSSKVSPTILKELLGHSKIETTMRYIRESPEVLHDSLRNTNWQ